MIKLITALFLLILPTASWSANLLPVSTTYIPQDSYGAELLTNQADREFSSDTGGWSKTGTTAIAGGVCNIKGADGQGISRGLTTLGKVYLAPFTVTRVGSGTVYINSLSGVGTHSTTGNYTDSGLATSTTFRVFAHSAGTDLDIDNISVKEVFYAIGTKSYFSASFRQNLPGTLSGDTAGVWSIISGPGANGKAYQIANTGSTDVVVTLTPTKALTVGRHYRPIVIAKRTVGSGTATYKLTGGTAVNITSATFVPLAAPAVATNTTDKPTFTVPAGVTIQFYQPKLLTINDWLGGFSFGNFDFRY